MRIVIQKSQDNQFYFIVQARNGQIIVTSETYKTKQACKKGSKSLRRNILFCKVVDDTLNQ